MTLKELKRLRDTKVAIDITHLSFTETNKLMEAENLKTISISTGIYGMNGGLFQGKSGQLYVVTSRSTTLFQLA